MLSLCVVMGIEVVRLEIIDCGSQTINSTSMRCRQVAQLTKVTIKIACGLMALAGASLVVCGLVLRYFPSQSEYPSEVEVPVTDDDLERLAKRIMATEQKCSELRDAILPIVQELKTGETTIVVDGKSLSRREAEEYLIRKFELLKQQEKALDEMVRRYDELQKMLDLQRSVERGDD